MGLPFCLADFTTESAQMGLLLSSAAHWLVCRHRRRRRRRQSQCSTPCVSLVLCRRPYSAADAHGHAGPHVYHRPSHRCAGCLPDSYVDPPSNSPCPLHAPLPAVPFPSPSHLPTHTRPLTALVCIYCTTTHAHTHHCTALAIPPASNASHIVSRRFGPGPPHPRFLPLQKS
jgi:hypothetical protein